MKIIAQPQELSDIDSNALNSLSHNNRRILEGSDDVIVNPMYEDTDDNELKEVIDNMLDKVFITDELAKIEEKNKSKFGPRSIAKKWEDRKASLFDYFRHPDYDADQFKPSNGRLRPVSIENAASKLIKSSSAGLPYMKNKGSVLSEAVSNHQKDVGVYPCVLYTRTQEGGKTRNVWGYPISDTIWEQQYFSPWLALERLIPWRAALRGPEAVDTAMTTLLNQVDGDTAVECVDFSAYDASITPEHSYGAFQTISELFQPAHAEDLYRMWRRFTSIPIYTPDGSVTGSHGVPSGSNWTNTVDSLVQYQVATTGRDSEHLTCQIQGDDGVYLHSSNDQDFLDRFTARGLLVNQEKSQTFFGKEAVYLQRYYHPVYTSKLGGLGGVYSLHRAMARLKYLERWTNFEQQGIKGSDF